ncbi:branched-chain amino acid ABC transporter permease [Streptomyces sp. ME03-5684b]|uniref:branched-chain amino acid ABC transporter permease n=1 Tax=Streptomyces sp. ME03-5684b TaxID=3028681 RepID=UPI0029A13C04|nr:branched-chain amino acid ABC transporter permease [Streptomyces sp. ME03-5684b]MDX3319658.1 branched-chain amino acid ABC transporter permease [Streptomyces sp. ME03-5684b]
MSQLFDFTLSGLGAGTTYALVGLGVALVFQATGVINFAQGDFVMLGGLGFAVLHESGVPLWAAAPIAIASTATAGALLDLLVISRARGADGERLIILTIGASVTLQGAALLAFGADSHFVPAFSTGPPLDVFGAHVPRQYLWCAAAMAAAVTLMWLLLTRTLSGTAMRATAMDAEAVRLMGVSPARTSLLAFTSAAALGALAGVVLAPLQPPDASVGIPFGLKGFTAAVIGGLVSPVGAVAGGLLVGLAEAYATGYLSSEYKDTLTYGMLVVLLVRPTGLLRRGPVVRV